MTVAQPKSLMAHLELLFTIFALLTLAGGLYPLYDMTGSRTSGYTDVNPIRFALSLMVFASAGAIAFYHWSVARETLSKNLLLLVVFALPLVSIVWSVDPETTFRRAFAHLLTGFLCLYFVTRMTPEEFMRRLVLALFVGGILSFLYVAAMPGNAIHQSGEITGSWKGAFGHKNELGRLSAIAVIAAMFMVPLTKLQLYMKIATIVMFLFLLVMSQSRTNWFILCGMLAVIPMMKLLSSERISRSLRMLGFVIAAGIVVLLVTKGAEALLAAFGRSLSFSGRATLWRGVNDIIAAKFAYLGAGYGAFFTPAGAVGDLAPYLTYWPGIPNHAHNGYLNTRADMGFPGIVILVLFLVAAGYRLLSRLMTEGGRQVWFGFTALFFLFLINNISESVAFKHSDIAWVIVLVAYGYAQPEAAARRSRPRFRIEVARSVPFRRT